MTSTVVIMLKNTRLNDSDLLSSAISQTLREYLEFVDSGQAGNEPQERYTCANGTEVLVIAVSSRVTDIPHSKPLCSERRAGADQAR